jgi:adenylate cyclase
MGFKPSRKNPNLCTRCCEKLPPGGMELEIAILFADIRGSTGLCERIGTSAYTDLLNRFYRHSTDVLVRHDAIIDKLIGDEVMALFIPGIAGSDYRHHAAVSAVELVTSLYDELSLPVGAAVNAGRAFVGNVGGEEVSDFTAVGDAVNTAAHLQALARSGEVVMADGLYDEVRTRFPGATSRSITVGGREAPVSVDVLAARIEPSQ